MSIARQCSINECSQMHLAKGYCRAHYKRYKKWGDANILKKPRLATGNCSVDKCSGKYYAKQLCSKHYKSNLYGYRLPGSPSQYDRRPAIIEGDIAKIPLGINAKDGYAVIDKEYSWIDKYNWSIQNGYAVNRSGRMHHIIVGCPSYPMVTDHINKNKLDNRSSNLRHVNVSTNGQNRSRHHNANNKYIGVHSNGSGWSARIGVGYERLYLGTFKNDVDAALAYNVAAVHWYGSNATLNDIM